MSRCPSQNSALIPDIDIEIFELSLKKTVLNLLLKGWRAGLGLCGLAAFILSGKIHDEDTKDNQKKKPHKSIEKHHSIFAYCPQSGLIDKH